MGSFEARLDSPSDHTVVQPGTHFRTGNPVADTLTDFPLETYDDFVNGKPALDWVVERQSVKTG